MKKSFLSVILIIFLCSFTFAQKKQPKTVQQQAKEFVAWFNTLNDIEKRSASKGLVDKLNSMDAQSKGIWLAALELASPTKKSEAKKVVLKPMDIQQIDKELVQKTTDLISSEPDSRYFYYNQKYSKLQSIIIKDRVSNKDRAEKYNAILQREMDSISIKLTEFKTERANLKAEIPEGYKPQYEDDIEYDNQGNKINDPIKPKYKRFNFLTSKIKQGTHDLADYPEKFLKGKGEQFDWDDTTKSRFLIEVTILPLDGLEDSKPIVYKYIGKYFPIEGDSSDYVYVTEPSEFRSDNRDAIFEIYSIY